MSYLLSGQEEHPQNPVRVIPSEFTLGTVLRDISFWLNILPQAFFVFCVKRSCSWTEGLPFSFLFRSIHCHVQAHGHVVNGGGLKPFLFGSECRLLSYVSGGGAWGGISWPIRMQTELFSNL